MENPTIVVITDRNDLDGQLFGVFSLAQDLREQPVQASSRQERRALLANRPSGGIVVATIQKFMPCEDDEARQSVPGFTTNRSFRLSKLGKTSELLRYKTILHQITKQRH